MGSRHAMLIVLASCGRIGFDPTEPIVDTPIDTPVTACTVAECPAGFVVSDGGCYFVSFEKRTWPVAQDTCASRGAHLLVTDSVAEHFTVHALTSSIPQVWIGWTDRKQEGVFEWIAPNPTGPTVNSSCFFPNGEPTAGDNAHCVAAAGANACGDHFDFDCEVPQRFVCECDGRLADPTTF